MADIYAFPTGADARAEKAGTATLPSRPEGVPDQVWAAVESVRSMRRIPFVRYREIPVPHDLADYGIGVELRVAPPWADETCDGTCGAAAGGGAMGWIMLLYTGQGREDRTRRRRSWRCVAFAALPLTDRGHDPLTPDTYWEDMRSMLPANDPDQLRGVVTLSRHTAFGDARPTGRSGCEIRVSYTPSTAKGISFDAGGNVAAWARFLHSTVCPDQERTVD